VCISDNYFGQLQHYLSSKVRNTSRLPSYCIFNSRRIKMTYKLTPSVAVGKEKGFAKMMAEISSERSCQPVGPACPCKTRANNYITDSIEGLNAVQRPKVLAYPYPLHGALELLSLRRSNVLFCRPALGAWGEGVRCQAPVPGPRSPAWRYGLP
jgi:hypothetical protein